MASTKYTINDFKIGENVVPLDAKELSLVIVDIDHKRGVIICRLSNHKERHVHGYLPHELEKEIIVRPPNIVDVPKQKPKEKNGATEMQEE